MNLILLTYCLNKWHTEAMRHSNLVKQTARRLRKKGHSLNEISSKTKVSKSTIRTWITDIQLKKSQKDLLKKRALKALQNGRYRAQTLKKEQRRKTEKILLSKGRRDIGSLTNRELFIAGVALYWAEGFKNKHEHRLGFCNADPDMINFYLEWLEHSLEIEKKHITARLTLNSSYKNKTQRIQEYWSQITGIPLDQFTKPFYQNTQWKKQYSDDNYHGVLRVHVKESLDYLRKMKGWIEGLKLSTQT